MVEVTVKQKVSLVLLGIFLALLIMEVTLRLGGFVMLRVQRNENEVTSAVGDCGVYRILALGESTTAMLFNGQVSWPEQLEEVLNERSNGIRFEVYNEGVAGKNSNDLLYMLSNDYSGTQNHLKKYTPNMVVAMMGINDYELALLQTENSSFSSKVDSFFANFNTYNLFKLILLHWEGKLSSLDKEAYFKYMLKLREESLADIMEKRGEDIREDIKAFRRDYSSNPITISNYRVMYKMLDKMGIKFVVMQYPLWSVDSLRNIFEKDDDVIFVSNEENFRAALSNGRCEDYFTDRFTYDFGHCTSTGNRLIAENLAEVILEYLNTNQVEKCLKPN